MATRHQTEKVHKDETNVDATAGGAVAGGVGGAAIGGVVGGPVGAGVGAVAGAAAGGAAGAAIDYSEAEPRFREHFEHGPYREITDWDHAEPAYRYGFSNAEREEYQGQTFERAKPDLRRKWSHRGRFEDMEPLVRTGWETRARSEVDEGGKIVIPVIEEEMRVGKREVETGGVRVETRVDERPVEQDVRLHEEHIEVHRRPVDRPATAADKSKALKEGSLELTETAEEVVVDKRARVIEEIVIEKEGRDRTQTVRGTVRKTDVEVDEEPEVAAFESFDRDFRAHHGKSMASTGYSFEQSTPAYRYGYTLGADGRYSDDWSRVEPEARRRWEDRNPGTWHQFKDAVRHGWQSVTGRR